MIKQFYLINRLGPEEVLPLQVRVDLVVMRIKGYSTLPKSSRTGPSPSDAV